MNSGHFQKGNQYRFKVGHTINHKHGYSSKEDTIPEYKCMVAANGRCNNSNDVSWNNYGGRVIKFRFTSIAEATMWIVHNLGSRPDRTYSIDRIDNDGHYEPGNLRWATSKEQMTNQRKRQTPSYPLRELGNEAASRLETT
jgi:hypothetical protein